MRLVVLPQLPRLPEFVLVNGRPFDYPPEDSGRQVAWGNGEGFYFNHYVLAAIGRMNVWGIVVVEIYGDFDSMKPGQLRHPLPLHCPYRETIPRRGFR